MDFLDYMKENFGKPYPPAIKFEDGKIYEDSYFTGFSISQKENYSTSAMYEVKEKILGSETPTNYQLEHDKSLAYCLGATFSVIGILASLVSPFILLIAPGFMVLWGLMILIHNHSKK